jgi:hypothetical protein
MAKKNDEAVTAVVDEMVAEIAAMETEIREIDPRSLVLLKTNARYMRHEQYQQLVANVRRDGRLTSVPLVAPLEDDPTKLEVLSGNHRTQAAIDAGLTSVPVMVILSPLTKDQRVALQLSHNAIAGQDDPAILKALYEELDAIDWRIYAGLDDKTLGLLEQVQPGSLTEVNLEFQSLSIVFLPEELDHVREVAGRALELARTGDETWIGMMSQHGRLLDAMTAISQAYNVTNTATVLQLLLDVFERHEHEIVNGWWDEISDTTRHNKYVPMSSVVGTAAPAEALAVIRKAIEKGQHGNSSVPAWQVLEKICGEFLSGE